jgi:hypothetical protein
MTNIVGLTFLTYFTISIIYDTIDIWDPYNKLAYETLDNDNDNDEPYYNSENIGIINDSIVPLKKDIMYTHFLREKI